jgi:hypothetical protein
MTGLYTRLAFLRRQKKLKIIMVAAVVVSNLRVLVPARRMARPEDNRRVRLPLACRPSRQMALARHLISRGIQPKSPATATRRRRLRAASR